LKVKVKPKIFFASRELADVAKILSAFQDQNQADGRLGFSKSLEFYLKALKFESQKILDGLEEEIDTLKSEMEKLNKARLERIDST
jgi:hypothetical protein